MHTRQFGRTDMQITPIGLGAWAIGGGNYEDGWGSQDDQQSIIAIKRALDLGINWIDTAPHYGLGHSEEIVGKAIKGHEPPYIFTKCSHVWDDQRRVSSSLKSASIQREAEASLKRLGVEVIDLYQIHWPEPDPDIEEGWSTLVKLKKEGKVRHIGVSNFNVQQLRRAERIAPVETLQSPYSLIHRDVEKDILSYCQQRNIGVIVYSPMVSGLLSGMMSVQRVQQMPDDDWRKRSPDFQGERFAHNLRLAELLTEIGFPHNLPAGVVAIAWTLHHPAITGAIVGFRNATQVEDLIRAAEFRLRDIELQRIEDFLRDNP